MTRKQFYSKKKKNNKTITTKNGIANAFPVLALQLETV